MRKIQLGQIMDLGPQAVEHRELMLQIMKDPANPQKGLNYEEMRKVVPIMDKIECANGSVLLEEAEWKELADRAKNFQFRTASKGILDFLEGIVGAEKCDVAAAPANKKDKPKKTS